jgi:hypothetical protein
VLAVASRSDLVFELSVSLLLSDAFLCIIAGRSWFLNLGLEAFAPSDIPINLSSPVKFILDIDDRSDSEWDVMYSCIDSDCLDDPDIDEFDVLPAVLLGVRGILVGDSGLSSMFPLFVATLVSVSCSLSSHSHWQDLHGYMGSSSCCSCSRQHLHFGGSLCWYL